MTETCTQVRTEIVYGPVPHGFDWWLTHSLFAMCLLALVLLIVSVVSMAIRRRDQ